MSKNAPSRIMRIKLEDLIPRSATLHRMSSRTKHALKEIIGTTGAYPAVIVRPHPRLAGKYEVIDGCSRVEILAELGESAARCEVWPLDDGQASLLAMSLNSFRGRPDVGSRAKMLKRLARSIGGERVGELLALTPAAMRQQLAPLKPPALAKQSSGDKWDLQPVVFHLSAAQQRRLNKALGRHKTVGGRADALMAAIGAGRKGDK